jgi:hypothetical protein
MLLPATHVHVQRLLVCSGVHCHCLQAQLLAGTDNPDSNLATICNQHFLEAGLCIGGSIAADALGPGSSQSAAALPLPQEGTAAGGLALQDAKQKKICRRCDNRRIADNELGSVKGGHGTAARFSAVWVDVISVVAN